MDFHAFRIAVNKSKKVTPPRGRLLALDPGETTGWAVFDTIHPVSGEEITKLVACGQYKTWPMDVAVPQLTSLLTAYHPTHIVHELYSIYQWKTDSHAWSQVPTLRVIGCLETLCIQQSIPIYTQTAQVAKNFVTDTKLEQWGYYQKGWRHARDALRHGCYFLLFGAPTE